jgi:hypothetical protein
MQTESTFNKVFIITTLLSLIGVAVLFFSSLFVFSPFEQVLFRGTNSKNAQYLSQKITLVLRPEKKVNVKQLESSIRVSPESKFTVTSDAGATSILFEKPLKANTSYSIEIKNSSLGAIFDHFNYTFKTKPIQVVFAQNLNSVDSKIILEKVGETGQATTLIQTPNIQSFVANGEYVAYSYGDLKALPLKLKLGLTRIADQKKLDTDVTLDLSNIFSIPRDTNQLLVKYFENDTRKIGIISLDTSTKPEETPGLENYKDAFELRLLQQGSYLLFNDISNNFYLRQTSVSGGEKLIGNYAKIAGEDVENSVLYATQFGNSKELIRVDLKGDSSKVTTNFDTNFNFLTSPDLTTFVVSDISKTLAGDFLPQVTVQKTSTGERKVIASGKDNSYNDFFFSADSSLFGVTQSSVFFSTDGKGNNKFEKKVIIFDSLTGQVLFELQATDEALFI